MQPTGPTQCVTLTWSAATAVQAMMLAAGRPGLAVRIQAEPGGRSGLRYQVSLDERQRSGDLIQRCLGIDVLIDATSAPLLEGAVLNHSVGGFNIDNHHARG
ncbi:MAG TPA: iron-sulfur cluster insertion protein ErpA [Actinomycetota bacterium]|nr:iron-sulfur cluster insertion protein ErpA [Actinomycetota bacterium]